MPWLPIYSTHDVHQFRDLAALIGLVAAVDGVFHAMGYVILKDFFFNSPERGTDRRDLRDDIDAVPVLVDHFRKATNLAFNAV